MSARELIEPVLESFMAKDLARSLLSADLVAIVSPRAPEEVRNFQDSGTGERLDAYRIYWTDTYFQTRINRPENKYIGRKGVTPPVAFLSAADPRNAEAEFKRSNVKAVVEGYKKAVMFALTTGIPTVAINGVSGWAESDGEADEDFDKSMRSEILRNLKPDDNLIVCFDGDWSTNDKVGGELAAVAYEAALHRVKCTCPDFGIVNEKRLGYDDWFATWNKADWFVTLDEEVVRARVYGLHTVPLETLDVNVKYSLSSPERYMRARTKFTDQGAATKFVQIFGAGNFFYLVDTGQWAFWNAETRRWSRTKAVPTEMSIQVSLHYERRAQVIRDSAWRIKGEDEASKGAREKIFKLAKPMSDWANKLEGTTAIANFVKNLANRTDHQRLSTDFDADVHLMAVQNGVVDLRTGQLREETQEDLITRRAAAAYTEAEPTGPGALRARAFVRSVTSFADGTPAPEREKYLQTRLGSGLRGFNSTTSADVLEGYGSNGKSAFATLMHHALGTYAVDLDIKTFVATNRPRDPEAARPHLVMVFGARFAFAKEFKKQDHLDESFLKEFTGGESVTARSNYKDGGSAAISANLLITTNFLPHLTHISKATLDRLAIFPFLRSWNRDQANEAGKEDADRWFIDEMKGDPDAQAWILWWLVWGGVYWEQEVPGVKGARRVGPMPADIVEARAEYIQTEDEMAEWMEAGGWFFSTEKGARAVQKELYDSYRGFKIQEKHVAVPESAKSFYGALNNYANGKIKFLKSGDQRYFAGITRKAKY